MENLITNYEGALSLNGVPFSGLIQGSQNAFIFGDEATRGTFLQLRGKYINFGDKTENTCLKDMDLCKKG